VDEGRKLAKTAAARKAGEKGKETIGSLRRRAALEAMRYVSVRLDE
jgi:hypothetical protein